MAICKECCRKRGFVDATRARLQPDAWAPIEEALDASAEPQTDAAGATASSGRGVALGRIGLRSGGRVDPDADLYPVLKSSPR